MIRTVIGRIKEVVTGKNHYVKGSKRRIKLVVCSKCGNKYPENTTCLICREKERCETLPN